jgi:hypothetical protein
MTVPAIIAVICFMTPPFKTRLYGIKPIWQKHDRHLIAVVPLSFQARHATDSSLRRTAACDGQQLAA